MALSPLAATLVRDASRTWNAGSQQPTLLTFSFATSSAGFASAAAQPVIGFTPEQQGQVRQALDAWAGVSGLFLVEVPDVADSVSVGLRFRIADLGGTSRYSANSPLDGGDITLDDSLAASAMQPGSAAYGYLLTTIGYAVGLNTVSSARHDATAMAGFSSANPPAAALFAADIEAIQSVYGTPAAEAAAPIRWSYEAGAVRHDGNDSSQTITGTSIRDIIHGHGGNDIIRAGAGDDIINAGTGGNTVSGGEGLDTLRTDAFRAQTTLNGLRQGIETDAAGSHASLSGRLARAGEDTLFNGIETIAFADGKLVFDAAAPVAQVVRLYQAALGRQPDSAGKEYWVAKLEAGAPLADLARSFLDSPEFLARFGRPDDAGFVATAYRQALGREADAEGQGYWQAKLAGGMTRADMLTGFSESAENKGLTAPLLTAGIWDADDQLAGIARLYKAVLGRIPEADGLRYWDNQADAGASEQQMANLFAASPEFNSRFPGATDVEFVAVVYQNTLGRGPDQAGQSFWLEHLANGLTRGEMVAGVTHSSEFLTLSAGLTEGGIVFV